MRKHGVVEPGQTFGLWQTLHKLKPDQWHCRCQCGQQRAVFQNALKSGRSRSCGCMKNRFRAEKLPQLWEKLTCLPSGCWVWTGAAINSGYGITGYLGRNVLAHRLAFELAEGPFPTHLDVCHNCPGGDNKLCCNPGHLFLGTRKDNMQDALGKGQLRVGMACPWTRLSDQDVRTIRERRVAGEYLQAIATDYQVSESMISGVARKQRRKHVV